MTRNPTGKGPKFVGIFWPVVKALKTLGGSARPAEVRDEVARMLRVSDAMRAEALPSGFPRFDNQVAWARFYLVKAGIIDSSSRGVWTLTDKGRALQDLPHKDALELFKSIHATIQKQRPTVEPPGGTDGEDVPPQDEASQGAINHRQVVLDRLRELPPGGFERFSQRLLRESGFQEVAITGKSGDGGIDGIGILQVNPLVSFKVLFQCKRYSGSVTPSQVRDFRGAMQGRADKGIIITTGGFTPDAKKEAVRDGVPPIELVDGEKLVGMLEELELGLRTVRAFTIDEGFFDEFKA